MFRFTIRDLLWLMVVMALALGWWASNQRQAARASAQRKSFDDRYKRLKLSHYSLGQAAKDLGLPFEQMTDDRILILGTEDWVTPPPVPPGAPPAPAAPPLPESR
jgi:hypothetical protein